ncbi:tail fiber protein [bacterium]|nr:tail fiber protein [bacterium]
MKKAITILSLFLFTGLCWGVPMEIAYQGRLTSLAGVGINDTVEIVFRLYDDPAAGTMLWEETHTGIIVQNGLFDALLGSLNPITLNFSEQYWLSLEVERDTLAPRVQLSSSPYAIRAGSVDSVPGLEQDDLSDNNLDDIGDVNIAGILNGDVLRWNQAAGEWQPTGLATDSTGDNWGSQVVVHNPSLIGNGTAASPLMVDWDTLTNYSITEHSHLFNNLIGMIRDAQVPDDITVLYADSTGAILWEDIIGTPDSLKVDTMTAYWDSIRNIPPDFADGIDDIDTTIADWNFLKNIPADIADGDDLDTAIAYWESLRNIPTGFDDNIDNVDDEDWLIDDANNYVYNTTDFVGIGTASPQYPLHVVDGGADYAFYSEGNLKINSGIDFGTGFGDSNQVLMADGEGNCDWQTIDLTGAFQLNDLEDVDTSGVVDGQVLKWIAVAGEWRPSNDVGGPAGADNWGTQVVTHNTSLTGDGTPAQPLGIQWQTLETYINNNIVLDDLNNVNTAGGADGQILTWVEAAGQWRPMALDSGSLGDNWGTQIVFTDTSLLGDGTAGNPLEVSWDTLNSYATVNWSLDDLVDVEIGTFSTDMALAWDNEDSIWKPMFDNDQDMSNELIDSLIWYDVPPGDTMYHTLRVVEHSIEKDVIIPVDEDDLSDNSINDLNDVNTTGAASDQIFRFDGTTWQPYNFETMLNTSDISDLGDVNGDSPIAGDVLEWNGTDWGPGTNIGSIVNTWQDYSGYLTPSVDDVIDFKIFDADSLIGVKLYDVNTALGGGGNPWYGMYIDRRGASASDGVGLRAAAATAGTVSPGSEFIGVMGLGMGGDVVYGVFGDGDAPGAGGTGYGVYGIGKNYGVYGEVELSNGYGVYGKALTYGVYGRATATEGYALYGQGVGYGLYATASATNGYAGYFEGDRTYFSGNVGIGRTSPTTKLDVNGRIKDKTGWVMPVGTVVPYAGSSAPDGWLLCDGTSYSTTTYNDLHTIIGYTYGGSGSTFNVPNLKGRVIVGINGSDSDFDNLNDNGGEKYHTLTISEMPSHNHGGSTGDNGEHHHYLEGTSADGLTFRDRYYPGDETVDLDFGGGSNSDPGDERWRGRAFSNYTGEHDHSISSQGGGDAHNNLQPYRVLNYIIKY